MSVLLVKFGVVKFRRSSMALFKRQSLARGILILVACTVFSAAFVVARHVLPRSTRQLITLQHQIRRVLSRAERENLKAGVSVQKAPIIIHPPQDFAASSRFSKSVLAYRATTLFVVRSMHWENFAIESSPVLNL